MRALLARVTPGDLAGAAADLGIMVPLAAALVLVNGLDIASLLICAGLLVLAAGLAFGIPFPVQPLKALTALAVAQQLSPEVIHAAGLQIGLILLLLSVTTLADRLALVFTKPVIRALQFGVGTLLVVTAVRLVTTPPAVFTTAPPPWLGLLLGAATLGLVALAARRHWYLLTLGLLGGGVAATWVATGPEFAGISLSGLDPGWPPLSAWSTAFVLLVIPQIPLTYGNAVVGVSDLARESFADAARRVTPGRVALSAGIGNTASALLGGMPMCHGSSGLSAHLRLGARSPVMNGVLGSAFLLLGIVFADQVLTFFSLLPVWILAGFLCYAGIRHAALVLDQRGFLLVGAIGAGMLGILTGNLALTTGAALLVAHGTTAARWWRQRRQVPVAAITEPVA